MTEAVPLPALRPMTLFAVKTVYGQTGLDRLFAGACPACGAADARATAKTPLSTREWEISGLCQTCQDRVFLPPTAEGNQS